MSISELEAAELPGNQPSAISHSPVFWDRITSIDYTGYEHVYDIEVEGTHNFIGNGIFAHNTYIGRQDAGSKGEATTPDTTRVMRELLSWLGVEDEQPRQWITAFAGAPILETLGLQGILAGLLPDAQALAAVFVSAFFALGHDPSKTNRWAVFVGSIIFNLPFISTPGWGFVEIGLDFLKAMGLHAGWNLLFRNQPMYLASQETRQGLHEESREIPMEIYKFMPSFYLPAVATMPHPEAEIPWNFSIDRADAKPDDLILVFRNDGYLTIRRHWSYSAISKLAEKLGLQPSPQTASVVEGFLKTDFSGTQGERVKRIVDECREKELIYDFDRRPRLERVIYQGVEYPLEEFLGQREKLLSEFTKRMPQFEVGHYLYRAVTIGEWKEIKRGGDRGGYTAHNCWCGYRYRQKASAGG